jgi:hypothetical protein
MPIATDPRESTGNATLAVLVNSAETEHGHVAETVLAALGHFGMPYRVRDLARGRLTAGELDGHAAAILAQEHLGLAMTPDDAKVLLGAVDAGLGLIGLDHDLGAYPGALADALGVAGTHFTGRILPDATTAVGVPGNRHFITWTHEPGTAHALRMPVPVAQARLARGEGVVLAENGAGAPALVATRVGRGRAVQWLVSPKLWLRQYLGHANGLDDLFWKGIVWAARKPFAMKAMPPFVRLRFDDCTGLWRDAADLDFARILAEAGHVPNLCVCIRSLTPDGVRAVRALADAGQAEVAPHTLEGGVSLFHGDAGGEYSPERLREIFREIDERFAAWGVRPSRILSDHDHEWSARAIPFLRERGIRYKMNITLPGERWTDAHVDWQPGPYGTMSYALDYLPGAARDFFAVFNHYTPAFDAARAYLPDGRFLYNRPGGFGPWKWDFLNGLTRHGDAVRENDIETAARRLAAHTRLGLDSLFFGGSISHSHFARHLSPGEWRALLARYQALTSRHERRNVGYDAIADHARAKVDTHLAHAERDPAGGDLRCRLTGDAEIPLELHVFRDEDDAAPHRFRTVPPFHGSTEVRLPA